MSKRFIQLKEKFNKEEMPVFDVLNLIKESANAKFDESIEAHIKLGLNAKKTDQKVRASADLPHGTGKTKKIAAFTSIKQKEAKAAGADIAGGEELIEEIFKTGKMDFDAAVATSEMMPKLAKIAKILGPKGLMPNPKTGTVTNEIEIAISALKAGRVEFRSDDAGIVHIVIGKRSFEIEKLQANFDAFMEALKKAKPDAMKGIFIKSITLCSTMGPGVKVKY